MVAAATIGMRRPSMIVLAVLTARAALAQPSLPPSPPETHDYQGQIVIADTAALGVLITVGLLDAGTGLGAGLGTYLLGAPIVHAAHGNYTRAAASFGLRVGLPVLGLVVGDLVVQATDPGTHFWNFDGPPSMWWLGGMAAGFIAATVVDTKLAKGPPRPTTTTIAPSVTAGSGGMALGLVGAF